MRRTIMDDGFDEWEAYVSAGSPDSEKSARIIFACSTTPTKPPRQVIHPGGDPTEAERELVHMSDEDLKALFDRSEILP